ncbi:YkgJ family cysteine cluster protein [Negadavirga shengliensis]|uniref:YkgJ family cysteine cluster protein n=1 Tax=Negadavirga shengliensis TaxID=1389218 RepID=A0ABV9T1C5_9BACT
MNLHDKSLEVQGIFEELEVEARQFLEKSQLQCLAGCGRCCTKPDIFATVLEFLPMALHAYQNGSAYSLLETINNASNTDVCIIFKQMISANDRGFCTDYRNRGLICRLFGQAARRDKNGNLELLTCKSIKEDKKDQYMQAQNAINESLPVPISSHYYQRLHNIDPSLGHETFPINTALKKALEMVLMYENYRQDEAG